MEITGKSRTGPITGCCQIAVRFLQRQSGPAISSLSPPSWVRSFLNSFLFVLPSLLKIVSSNMGRIDASGWDICEGPGSMRGEHYRHGRLAMAGHDAPFYGMCVGSPLH